MSRLSHHGKPCPYCKRPMNMRDFHLRPTWDHVVPKSRGGRAKIVCCHKCNGLKGDVLPEQWVAYMVDNPGWWLLTRAERRARARAAKEALRTEKWGPRKEAMELILGRPSRRQGSPPARPVAVPAHLIWKQPAVVGAITAEENGRRLKEYTERMEREREALEFSRMAAEEAKRRWPNWPDMRRSVPMDLTAS